MSIFIPGTLTIIAKTGRFGAYHAGKLTTSIGEFVVKDKNLIQYDEGKYDGQFEISNIRSVHYTYGNGLIVECRAYLANMILDNNADLTEEEIESFSLSDPLEEEKETTSFTQNNREANEQGSVNNNEIGLPTSVDDTNDDINLFGLVWPLGNKVMLDPTVSRGLLCQQKTRLQELGYQFDYRTQTWHLE